ncbi:MAG: hypothetical protein ACM3WU_09270 [Bacillota bacterium]
MSKDRLARLTEALVMDGHERMAHPPKPVAFTRVPQADELENDLERYPHAFVIACVIDRLIRAEKAWCIRYHLRQAIGSFEFADIAKLTGPQVRAIKDGPPALHRFPETMTNNLYSAICRIGTHYEGNASMIWRGTPSSATIVRRS